MMYWLSWLYYSYLALSKDRVKASGFLEQFAFIMHMKDLVKLQLSMRKLAQVYHYVEPRLAKKAKDIEVDDSLEYVDNANNA